MAYYLKSGRTFRVSSKESLDLHESLPVNTYTVQYNQEIGFYLAEIDRFKDIKKHYGDNLRHVERIYRTFMDRNQSTGVMLTGAKGSGKSLLAKTLSIRGVQDGVSTIVVNSAFNGDAFNKFVQSIDEPTIFLFDEFEKVYDKDEQEAILTLLDGVYPSKKLFIITCNDKWRVDVNMRNRPGRIFYMIDYAGLDAAFVREYCEDNLKNQAHIDKTCNIAALFAEFNFDMLKSLVEEMNRYNEDPADALKILNAKPEYDGGNQFNMVLTHNGKKIELDDERSVWKGNPLNAKIDLRYVVWINRKDDNYRYERCHFEAADIVSIDAGKGEYVFKAQKSGEVLTLTKVPLRDYNYLDQF